MLDVSKQTPTLTHHRLYANSLGGFFREINNAKLGNDDTHCLHRTETSLRGHKETSVP